MQRDGIRFQGFRYLDVTLAAYIGEEVIIRYDPRDMAEIRVYHNTEFLCRAIAQELEGQTITLKEIVQARNRRRQQLRADRDDRQAVVELLLEAHQAPPSTPEPTLEQASEPSPLRLKRYAND
ncbi:MAG: hypothetical protein HGA45_13065 [Chloroflexales bacterium]|nr:hypothetical protein [Chloroflexales bacterium]